MLSFVLLPWRTSPSPSANLSRPCPSRSPSPSSCWGEAGEVVGCRERRRAKKRARAVNTTRPLGRILWEQHLPWDSSSVTSSVRSPPVPAAHAAGRRRRVCGKAARTSFGRGAGISGIVRTSSAAANCDVGRTLSGSSGDASGPTSAGNTPHGNALVGNSNDKRPGVRGPRRRRLRRRFRRRLPRRTWLAAARGHAAKKIPRRFVGGLVVTSRCPTAGGLRVAIADTPVGPRCVACRSANANGCGVGR